MYWTKLKHDPLAMFCVWVLLAVIFCGFFANWLAPFDPLATDVRLKFAPMSAEHWLGADNLGRDVFSRLLFGVRTTVFYALLAMVATLLVGISVGLVAGTLGGKTDERIMRGCDVMLSFPSEVMILALVGVLGVGIGNIVLAMVLVKWAWYARMVRGIVQQYVGKNYVQYARVIGLSPLTILRRHLLPVALAELLILATADIGSVILMISALSFLGLGVQAPVPEWGSMLADAKNVLLIHPEQMLAPGLAIVLVVVSFNGLGDFLRDYLDAKNIEIKNVETTSATQTNCIENPIEPLMPDSALLRLERLTVATEKTILLNAVSLTLSANRTLAIIGESGSGKTLLAKAILGLLPDTLSQKGQIFYQNRPLVMPISAKRGRDIALIPQDPMNAFNPRLTLKTQFLETLRHHFSFTPFEAEQEMLAALKAVQLAPELLGRYPHQLSGGQLQRMILALTLALKPTLIIADEPTTALDALTQAELLPLFKQLGAQATLVFITHDLGLAKALSDEVAIFRHGELLEIQPTDALFANPKHDYTRYLLAQRAKLNEGFDDVSAA